MRPIKRVVGIAVALGTMACGASVAMGMPIPANGLVNTVEPNPLVQDVRIYCYNRYTGQFKHWGPCRYGYGGGYYRRSYRYYRPYYGYHRHFYRRW